MSLLDDVSIVVTPNGYKAGELYAVVPVPSEGAEEVINGDFATDSDWTKGAGWTISGGTANASASSNGADIRQTNIFEPSKTYKISITANKTSGTSIILRTYNGSFQTIGDLTENSSFIYATSSTNNGTLYVVSNNFVGSVDNVSVKEWTGADMDVTRATAATRVDENGLVNYAEILGGEEVTNGDFANGTTDWSAEYSATLSIVSGQLKIVGGRSAQGITTIIGKTYSISANITNIDTVGGIRIKVSNNFNLDGAYYNSAYNATTTPVLIESIFTATATTTFVGSDQNGTSVQSALLDNISVKEVTRDNVPRIDYTGGGCPHILAEPQRTNLLTYSEDFSSGIWGNYNSTVTSSVTTAPDGLLSGSKFSGTADVTAHTLFLNAYTVVASNDYTYSVFAKKNESNFIQINTGSGFSNLYANFDLDNGVVGNFNTLDANIESYSNGWFKCSVKANSSTTTGQTTFSIIESLTDARNPSFNALNKSVYIWGAQLEEGSYATSYIPTSGSTVTRNQDIFTRDGIGSLINSTEGVLFVEMAALSLLSDVSRVIMLTSSDGLNYVNIYFQSNGKLTVYNNVNGVNTVLFEQVLNDITLFNKCALKWGSQGYELWANGIKLESSTSTSVPIGLSEINFNWNGGIRHFYGKVKQLQVYKTALTDDELTILTGTSGVHFFPSYASMASDLTYTIE